jgi:predicted O-linked N-acetylglucosamine transferase (SPINDLY family)
LTLHYRAGVNLIELAEAHAEFDRRHGAPLRSSWKPHENSRTHDRPLRLGFLSSDFGQHPVGYFLIRVLENLEQCGGEIICYSDRIPQDELTSRFQTASTTWFNVAPLSDERLAQQIREDRIDILFDLAGHTARNRLLVFARKPAPIQITWIGYVGTTGLDAMDYIVADRHEIPAAAEKHYCEKVLRMPDGYVCYDPPGYAPPVSPLPAEKNGWVTFGCFNNPSKITAQVVETWAKILIRVPRSRVLLKYRGMNDSSVVDRFSEIFAVHGVDTDRLTFLGRSSHEELLREYRNIDIALDPFPYSGGLTTCEALWMGVPVITCPGETFASRHSLSHLSNVGLTETVARDLSEYVELASGLANDLPRLSKWRAELRERMSSSPLCDGPRFAGNLMDLLRDVWQEWCEQN